jgi:hypothetical protein
MNEGVKSKEISKPKILIQARCQGLTPVILKSRD